MEQDKRYLPCSQWVTEGTFVHRLSRRLGCSSFKFHPVLSPWPLRQAGMGVDCWVQQANLASKRLRRSLAGSGPHPGEGDDAWNQERVGEQKEAATRQTPKSLLLGGMGCWRVGTRPSHCTACSLALLPESCGFITSGSSGGLEKGSMRRASNASSARKASPTVAGACGLAV